MKVRRFIEGRVDGVGGVFNLAIGVKAAAGFCTDEATPAECEAGANEAESGEEGWEENGM
jgi:hypothetical protein